MRNVIVGFLVSLCMAVSADASFSYNRIKSVELDPATVCLGEEVQVTVVVEMRDRSFNRHSTQDWNSTSIDGVCYEHGDHSVGYGTDTFTEVFTIIAPGTQGVGNVQIKIFENDGCSRNKDTENVNLTIISCVEDGLHCWDTNGDFECDVDEDINDDQVCDVLDCHGLDGDDCTIEQVRGGAEICCGNRCVTIFNGLDGEDGVDGEGCTVRPKRHGHGYIIECGDGTSAVIYDGRDGEPGEDGLSCWDLNGNGEKDFAAEKPWWCRYLPWKSVCQESDFTEDTNDDGEIDVEDCRGVDGTSCTVSEGRNGCAYISCDDDTSAVICDGSDGQNGVDGTSCTVTQQSNGVIIVCGDSQVFVANGLNCWDTNGNGDPDFCHPQLADLFEGCPEVDDFSLEYECEEPPQESSKAMLAAKDHDGYCSAVVTCEVYLAETTDADEETISFVCGFTEDQNGDGEIDAIDCRGDTGDTGRGGSPGAQGDQGEVGPQGEQGEPGIKGDQGESGNDGFDGTNCDVVDNLNASCTIVCPDSEVFVYDCGVGAEPVEEEVKGNPCGEFSGLTVVGMLLTLGFMRFNPNRRRFV